MSPLIANDDAAKDAPVGDAPTPSLDDRVVGFADAMFGMRKTSNSHQFDVFPHADVASATETYDTVIGEGASGASPTGASFAASSFAISGDTAYLAVRQGKLVFALAVPNDINTEAGLVALAKLVVERAGDAASE